MSVILTNTNINYGNSTSIIVDNIQNINIQPSNFVSNIEITLTGIIATVNPTFSTIFFINGNDLLGNPLQFNETVYVNVTLEETQLEIVYGESITITAYGSSKYQWLPGNIFSESITVSPKKDTIYAVLGTDIFNTVTRTSVNIKVNSNLIFTPEIPTVYEGNLLIVSVNYYGAFDYNENNQNNEITYTWKSNLFINLPDYCSTLLYGDFIKINPTNNIQYHVTVYNQNNIISEGFIEINVIPKPSKIIDNDIIPLSIYSLVIERNRDQLSKELLLNQQLSKKIIFFYYTILQTAYRMEFTNKSGISYRIPWFTYYQKENEINEMILTFEQQWNLFKYINMNQTRAGITISNFAYLLNIVNSLFLEKPQKIYITPLN
jgi:hypothetical protein